MVFNYVLRNKLLTTKNNFYKCSVLLNKVSFKSNHIKNVNRHVFVLIFRYMFRVKDKPQALYLKI